MASTVMTSFTEVQSRRPVQRPDPRRRLILPYLEHARSRLGFRPDAPPRDECARERRIREVNRDCIDQYPAHSRRRRLPAIGAVVVDSGPDGWGTMPLALSCSGGRSRTTSQGGAG